jgi:hypothetical protein
MPSSVQWGRHLQWELLRVYLRGRIHEVGKRMHQDLHERLWIGGRVRFRAILRHLDVATQMHGAEARRRTLQ